MSFDTSHCLSQRRSLTAVVNGILNVTQDTVGNILLGGIRREVIIWLQSIMAILLSICHNVQHVKPTSPITLMCRSKVIIPSSIIGNRDFFRCMGGKTHVICRCNNMPFIPTNTWREVKRKCIKCNRLESFVCCSSLCSAHLCKKCYDACPINDVTTIDPTNHVIDDGMFAKTMMELMMMTV